MPLSVLAKVIIAVVVLGVVAGLTVTIILVVNNEETVYEEPITTTTEMFTDNTETPIPDDTLQVGVGIADMTGPCVEIAFMGYAELSQTGEGIHTRQFARSFIFKKGDTRIVLVSAEVQSIGIAVRREVVRNLQTHYGDIYTLENVIVAGTHTHSVPGGYLVDFIFDVTILGFSQETFNAYVDGITRSIIRAHENMVPAKLIFSQATVENAQKNRSPFSYDYNPEEERLRLKNQLKTQAKCLSDSQDA